MTKNEILTKIDSIKSRLFMLNMVDRWTDRTRDTVAKLERELTELENQLEKI